MEHFKIPSEVITAFMTGSLEKVKKENRKGTLDDGYLCGIFDGKKLAELRNGEDGLTYAMLTAIEGLKLQDPKWGIANYPQPKGVQLLDGKKDGKYITGYIRGMMDTFKVLTFRDYESNAVLAMQNVGFD